MHCPYCKASLEVRDDDLVGRGVTERWSIRLPLEPPSQNVVSGNKGNHAARRRYKAYRDDYVLLLKNALQQQKIPRARGKRRVIVTRLYAGKGQERDHGNVVGGCKPLLDALHHEDVGLIVDDSKAWCEDHYEQAQSLEHGVLITIEELGGEQ